MIDLLKQLTQEIGPSGFEQRIARVIFDLATESADSVTADSFGNVMAFLKGTTEQAPSLLVSAHMDEVGFIVKKIELNGLLRFEKIGGHDDRILLAERVRILGQSGPVPGVIGTISAHYQRFDDPNKIRRYQELYIDCGAESREEVLALGIDVGSPISWATEVEPLGSHRLAGKAFDDRAGCAVQIAVLRRLFNDRPPGDVCFLFSVQEEVGLRGAEVASYRIHPDFALAVDTTPAGDTLESIMDQGVLLGKGPAIKVMDNSFIANPILKDHLAKAASLAQIPYQLELFMGIGTDAGAIHRSRDGIPTGVISIPSRYAHSPVEVIDRRDLEYTADLLEAAIRTLPNAAGRSFIDFP